MGEPWVDHPSWEVVEEASAATNRDLSHLLLRAEMEELTQTANAQLATTVLSLVILDAVERVGLTPAACAGHSLGEYTALVASGALTFEHGIGLVVARGNAMARPSWASPMTTPKQPASGPRVTSGWPTTTPRARSSSPAPGRPWPRPARWPRNWAPRR